MSDIPDVSNGVVPVSLANVDLTSAFVKAGRYNTVHYEVHAMRTDVPYPPRSMKLGHCSRPEIAHTFCEALKVWAQQQKEKTDAQSDSSPVDDASDPDWGASANDI